MRALLISTLALLSILSAVAFLVSCLSPFVSPELIGWVALPGLFFPWFLLLQMVWLFVWLVLNKRYALYTLLILLLGSYNIVQYFGWSSPAQSLGHSISVMSWNVKNFDLYSWANNVFVKQKMMLLIEQQQADILVLQEFYTDETEQYNTIKQLQEWYPYNHFRRSLTLQNSKYWGQVTLSKYPIIGKELMRFSNTKHNMCLITDIAVGDDTISIYNVHLQSIHFDEADYESVQTVTGGNLKNLSVGTLLSKLNIAYKKRAHQTDTIVQHILQNKYPVVLCGDFNDSPNSFAYRRLNQHLKDAFRHGDWGIGKTYTGPFPSLRIDFIMHSPAIITNDFEVLKTEALSDHYPIKAELRLSK